MMKLWGLLLVMGMTLIVTHGLELFNTWEENNKVLERLHIDEPLPLDKETLTIHKFDIEKRP